MKFKVLHPSEGGILGCYQIAFRTTGQLTGICELADV